MRTDDSSMLIWHTTSAMAKILTIPRKITKGTDLVVLPRHEYEELQRSLAEIEDTIGKIRRGEKEFRAGKTRRVKTLSALRRS